MKPDSTTTRKILATVFSDNHVSNLLNARDSSAGTKLKSIEVKVTTQNGPSLSYLVLFEYYEPDPSKNTFDDVAVKLNYDLNTDTANITNVDVY